MWIKIVCTNFDANHTFTPLNNNFKFLGPKSVEKNIPLFGEGFDTFSNLLLLKKCPVIYGKYYILGHFRKSVYSGRLLVLHVQYRRF